MHFIILTVLAAALSTAFLALVSYSPICIQKHVSTIQHVSQNGEELEQMQELMQACIATESATEADMLRMISMEEANTETAKCLYACMMEGTGMIVNGKFDLENNKIAAKRMTNNNEEKIKVIESVAEECDAKMATASTSDR